MVNVVDKVKSEIVKTFNSKGRHIRYNFEKSPSDNNDAERVFMRYHFVVVDNRFIEQNIEKIQQNFQNKSIVNYPFNEVHRMEGKFKSTGFNYLFLSFDTEYTSKFLSFEGISLDKKRDFNLRERKELNIEDYVSRLYD